MILTLPVKCLVVAVLAVPGIVGCGTPGAPLPSDVKDPARRAYYEGMRELADADYVKATTYFQAVAASPRHMKYAALAKLRLGDTLFFQGRYAEATEVFRGFVQQHNADPNMPYARFMAAQCYFERLPGEWFASPPAFEFDQTTAIQAEAELKGFLSSFPTSVYAPKARKMLAKARKLLFAHEMYAVEFYEDRDKWQAVAWRLRDAIENYPELGLKDDLVWRMSTAWDKVGDRSETARSLGLYVTKFPAGKRIEAAKQRLADIRKKLESETKPEEKPAPAPVETPAEPAEPESPGGPDDFKLKPPELPTIPE